jgi:hypothetical protein
MGVNFPATREVNDYVRNNVLKNKSELNQLPGNFFSANDLLSFANEFPPEEIENELIILSKEGFLEAKPYRGLMHNKPKFGSYRIRDVEELMNTVMGPNIQKQIITVIPDFFDGKYIMLRSVPKPENEQDDHPKKQFIYELEDKVIFAKNSDIGPGYVIDMEKNVTDLLTSLQLQKLILKKVVLGKWMFVTVMVTPILFLVPFH